MAKFKITYDDGSSEIVDDSTLEGALATGELPRPPGVTPPAKELPALLRFLLPMVVPGGPLGGAVGGAAGELGAQAMEGQDLDWSKIGTAAGLAGAGGLVGTVAGKALTPLASLLSKVRISGTGRGGDATRVGQAIEDAVPSLAPVRSGPEGLLDIAGPAGQARLSATLGAEKDRLAANLPTSGAGVGYVNPRAKLEELFTELTQAGHQGYSAQGVARDSVTGAVAQRERADIVKEITKLLDAENPDLAAAFRQAEQMYGRGKEIRRALEPSSVLGTKGLDQGMLQQMVLKRMKKGKTYDPDLLDAIFRGGTPPVGDWTPRIPIGRGFPIGLTYLAGPGGQAYLDRILGSLGAGAPSLSRWLMKKEEED